jgi:hypothetical protein
MFQLQLGNNDMSKSTVHTPSSEQLMSPNRADAVQSTNLAAGSYSISIRKASPCMLNSFLSRSEEAWWYFCSDGPMCGASLGKRLASSCQLQSYRHSIKVASTISIKVGPDT